jgi:hypothetical protein
MLALNNTQFLVLARDGNGRGIASTTSLYRSIVVYDVSAATNIAGTAYDTGATPIAPGGTLASGITPATSTVLVNLNDTVQLAKFGLNNGPVDDINTLSEKWEALALVPALDPAAPNDWFLFVGNDNDFITTSGFQDGAAYAAAFDNDTMVLVYRLTLPGRTVNFSSRAQTGIGSDAHIMGFVVTGAKPKQLLIRAAGPALGGFGLSNVVSDPSLAIYDRDGRRIFSNDNWNDSANAADIRNAIPRTGAFAFPEASKDSALLVDLDPGVYSAHAIAASGTGVSLIEVYELP